MRQAALIVNPFASRVTPARLAAVQETLSRTARLETLHTERRDHATELARALGPEVEAIYAFSGDGGFNEVLNGLDGSVPVGFVPGGGTNVLPRALGLPSDPVRAAERIAAGRGRRISLGRVNGRRFGFSAGIGLDAELVRRVDRLGRSGEGRRAGDLAFVWTAVRLLAERRLRLDPVLEIAGLGRAAFALAANCDPYTYAGRLALHVLPDARFELGLDVLGPRSVRARKLPRFLWFALTGRGQTRASDVLYRHDLDRVEIACDAALPLQADGEDLGDVERAVLEAERDAVTVLV
jgi:diacylglycerol kinase family enzyme